MPEEAQPAKDNAEVSENTEKAPEVESVEKQDTPIDPGEKKPEEIAEGTADPIEYTDFTLSEGVELDKDLLGEFKTLATDLNLSQDKAQGLVDLWSKQLSTQQDAIKSQVAEWEKTVEALPKHEEMLGKGKKALVQFADADTQALFSDTWIGSHPGVIQMLAKVGELVSEARHIEGGTTAPTPPALSMAERMYPSKK